MVCKTRRQPYRRSHKVLQTWKSNRDPTPCNIVLASSATRARARKGGARNQIEGVHAQRGLTRLCAPGVRQEHPRHDFISHPLAQLAQHRFVPPSRTRLQNVRLDVLIAHACNERLVPIRKPKQFKRRPQFGVLHGRGDIGRGTARVEREGRGEELLEPAREGRGQDGEDVRLEVDDVGGGDGVA